MNTRNRIARPLRILSTSLLLVASPGAGWAQTNGLMGYYPFDGNANDASGNGHHGTVISAVLTTNRFGQPNSAYQFNGIDGGARIQISDTTFAGYRDFTLSAWVWMEEANRTNTCILQTASAEIYYSPAADSFYFALSMNRNGGTGAASVQAYTLAQSGLENAWHHLALVGYTNNSAKFYLDGQEVALSNGGQREQTLSHNYATIGAGRNAFNGGTPGYAFKGLIDEARIYNRALDASEVAGLLWVNSLKFYAGVNVYGPVGSNCLVRYATNLTAPVTWTPLQSLTVATNPTVIIDYDSPGQPQRFYQILPQ